MRIGVITDLHLSTPDTPDGRWINTQPLARSAALLDSAVHLLSGADLDALALLGDLAEHGSPQELEMLRARLAIVPAPVWAVAGNHDLAQLDDPLAHADLRSPGQRGCHVDELHIAGGTLRHTGGEEYVDVIDPTATSWRAGAAVVWLSHFPVLATATTVGAAGLPHAGDLTNRSQIADTLSTHAGPVIVLAGHLHIHLALRANNILQLDHPALAEWPHGLAILDIAQTEEGLHVHWHVEHLALRAGAPVNTMLADADEYWCWRESSWHRIT